MDPIIKKVSEAQAAAIDPAKPENEGKVFKYRFGQKIMDKISSMIEVDESVGESPVDVTCAFEGANLVLKVKQVGGFSNYDEAKFAKQTEIVGINDPAFQTKLFTEMHDLTPIAAPDKFKTLEKLTEEFKSVLGTGASAAGASAAAQADAMANELDNFDAQMEQFNTQPAATAPASTASALDDLDDLLP